LHAGHERRRQKLEAVASRRCKILSHLRAGSTGEFESSRDVGPTILIVAEYSLDPAQCLQARRKIKGLPGLSSELGELTGRCVRRCDLAAAELNFGEQGQRKGRDRRGASRSCRTDNAAEHSAGVHLLLDLHQRSGRFRRSRRKLTKRIDELQRFEQRLDQRSRSMIVALLGDRPQSGLARSATAADGWRAAGPRLLPHRRAKLPLRSLSTAYELCCRRATPGP
jgi:hypothetical protein